MNRGPQAGAVKIDFRSKAEAAWGAEAPDWVLSLADAVTATSQTDVARRVGYSAATISQVLSATYRGDLDRVEGMVRGSLMSAVLDCPVKGEMRRDVCLAWQRKPFAATSSDRVRMFHACRSGCPHSKLTTKGPLDV